MMQLFVFLVCTLLVPTYSFASGLSQKQMQQEAQKRKWDNSSPELSSGSPTPQNSPHRRSSGQNPELAGLPQFRLGIIDFTAINPPFSENGLTRRILTARRTIKPEQPQANRPSSVDIRATALVSLAHELSIRTPSPVAFAPASAISISSSGASSNSSASPIKPLARTPIPATPATPLVRDTPTTPMDDQ